MLNRNFNEFKFQHKRKKNQIIYTSRKTQNDREILNLIDIFLLKKIALFLNLLRKER